MISIIAQADMPRIWKAAGCGEFFNHAIDGAACIHIDADVHMIDSVFILVNEAQESAMLEEIYQAFGVRNDHQIYHESLTYDGADRVNRITLAAIDKKVLIVLYKYLEPGDDEEIVRRKFDAHWHTIDID